MNSAFENRIRLLQDEVDKKGPVIYWMSRDQRLNDNWAVVFAQKIATEKNTSFGIVFSLVPDFLEATLRQYDFMLKGLQEVESKCKTVNIPFYLLLGKPEETIPEFCKQHNISALISDFDPLKIKRIWKREIAKQIEIPFYEVDAHNIVPCLKVSNKAEFAAYTIRPKIKKLLPDYLDEFPEIKSQKNSEGLEQNQIDWEGAFATLQINKDVKPVDWLLPGESNAVKTFQEFKNNRLDNYDELRNDPNQNVLSNLSPYLHFGQISAQQIALDIAKTFPNNKNAEAFLEELIIRRELSDNFCYFNTKYDSFDGFHDWAKKSLNEHRKDEREYLYTLSDFENSKTHDELWNAAQKEMVNKGKMHGYMRMYWAKKILEWTESPEQALEFSIYLNDKYELDGREPNGYVGCAWSIGGVHDRAWTERPVYGKIRYMNYNGAKRKFDVKRYVQKNYK